MFALPISVNYSIIILWVWQNDESSMNNWDNLFALYTNKYRDKIKSRPAQWKQFDWKTERIDGSLSFLSILKKLTITNKNVLIKYQISR